MIFDYALVIALVFYIYIVIKRVKKYNYDTTKDYIYNLEKDFIATVELQNSSFRLSYDAYDTLFLKVEFSFNPISYFLKPYITIQNQKHYFEYGTKGIRYLNLSGIDAGEVSVDLHYLSLKEKSLSLYGYKNSINLQEPLLILAPHADDAEIAGFGLYKSAKNVTIVTTTIGEHGNCNYCDIYNQNRAKATLKKAELRVIDALSVGLYGGVDIKDSIALGYFGGTLQWMQENPDKDASSLREGIEDRNKFRRVSHANIKLPAVTRPNYKAFVDDLVLIISQFKPANILTPHPAIDSHPDHKYTTYALLDALKETKHRCNIVAYTNHLALSESYPVGSMHASITLPPNFKEFYFDSIYSFNLEPDLQIDKFFALEAIHDLRDSSIQISIKKAYKHLSRLITRVIKGKDKSYYRRAVRANELFFVIESENSDRLLKI